MTSSTNITFNLEHEENEGIAKFHDSSESLFWKIKHRTSYFRVRLPSYVRLGTNWPVRMQLLADPTDGGPDLCPSVEVRFKMFWSQSHKTVTLVKSSCGRKILGIPIELLILLIGARSQSYQTLYFFIFRFSLLSLSVCYVWQKSIKHKTT